VVTAHGPANPNRGATMDGGEISDIEASGIGQPAAD
jgi:hypothetical protein